MFLGFHPYQCQIDNPPHFILKFKLDFNSAIQPHLNLNLNLIWNEIS